MDEETWESRPDGVGTHPPPSDCYISVCPDIDNGSIATKYTTGFRRTHVSTEPIQSNFVGNSVKSMNLSVKNSLEKLQTDYIDILYVHWWDFTTSVEEVMHGLNALVSAGKVLYLGVSGTPAWLVVKANAYARANGLRPFSVYQGKWNAGFRDLENEIVPMCRDQGMAIAPFAVLGQAKFRPAEQRNAEYKGSGRAALRAEEDDKVSDVLEAVAKRNETSLYAIVSFTLIPTFCATYKSRLTNVLNSGSRMGPLQGTLRLPYYWTTECSAHQSQHRSSEPRSLEGGYG